MANSDLLNSNTLRQLELLKIRARRSFLGTRQGGHISLKRGHGIEFSDYRKYELGDDPRHIDWGVYARSERLYVKRFQEEEDLSVAIMLDSSASMHTPSIDEKWATSVKIALALSYVTLMQQDRLLVNVPGIFEPDFTSGGRAYHYIAKELTAIQNPCSSDFIKTVERSIYKLSHPGRVFMISDFLMPFNEQKSIFQALQAKNLDITAIQVLGPEDLKPCPDNDSVIIRDSETDEEFKIQLTNEIRSDYEKLLKEHNFQLQKYWLNRGINFVQVNSKDHIDKIILNDLTQTGLLQ